MFLFKILPLAVIALGLLSSPDVQAAKRIRLKEALKAELNTVIKVATDLHAACVSKSDKEIKKNTKKLVRHLNKANKKSALAAGQKTHLVKILNKAKDELEISQYVKGKERRKRLSDVFRQIVQIAKLYEVDTYGFRMYFCSKDKSVWIQRGTRPQNPINPDSLAKCGQRIYRR